MHWTAGIAWVTALLLLTLAARTRWEMRWDPDSSTDYREAALDVAREMATGAWFFGLMCPSIIAIPLGALLLLFSIPHLSGGGASDLGSFIANIYLILGLPALVTGGIVGALRPWLSGWRSVLLVSVISLLMYIALWTTWLLVAEGSLGFPELVELLRDPTWGVVVMAAAAGIALAILAIGALCGAFYLRRYGAQHEPT